MKGVEKDSLNKKEWAARPAHLHRITDVEVRVAREVLQLAFYALEPSDLTQRQTFSKLMPTIYVLRNKQGYTFKQITSLLEQCGFKLTPSSVRVYYSEMLPDRQAECISKMAEEILILAEIKKETEGVEISLIAEKASAILNRKRTQEDF